MSTIPNKIKHIQTVPGTGIIRYNSSINDEKLKNTIMYRIIDLKTLNTVKTLNIFISITNLRIVVLETAEERVKLLKAGLTGKEIERLYIEKNNIKIVRNIFYKDL